MIFTSAKGWSPKGRRNDRGKFRVALIIRSAVRHWLYLAISNVTYSPKFANIGCEIAKMGAESRTFYFYPLLVISKFCASASLRELGTSWGRLFLLCDYIHNVSCGHFFSPLFCEGDLYFDKAVNCFLKELFQKWKVSIGKE